MEANEQGWELEGSKDDKNIAGVEKHEIHFRKFNFQNLQGDQCAV